MSARNFPANSPRDSIAEIAVNVEDATINVTQAGAQTEPLIASQGATAISATAKIVLAVAAVTAVSAGAVVGGVCGTGHCGGGDQEHNAPPPSVAPSLAPVPENATDFSRYTEPAENMTSPLTSIDPCGNASHNIFEHCNTNSSTSIPTGYNNNSIIGNQTSAPVNISTTANDTEIFAADHYGYFGAFHDLLLENATTTFMDNWTVSYRSCDFSDKVQPHFIEQCKCGGQITVVSQDILALYTLLKEQVMTERIPTAPGTNQLRVAILPMRHYCGWPVETIGKMATWSRDMSLRHSTCL
jgi:hypothetical protein